jgi:hypothetical protein
LPATGGAEERQVGSVILSRADADGVAALRLNLLLRPGVQTLTASFVGTIDLARAATESPFLLTPSPTILTLTPSPSVVAPHADSTIVATLTDATALPERMVSSSSKGRARVVTAITDFNGRASRRSTCPTAPTRVGLLWPTVTPPRRTSL